MHTILRLLAALFTPTTYSLAYIMDDTNQTIQYSPLGRWETEPCAECFGGTEYELVLYPWTCECAHPLDNRITEHVIIVFIVTHFHLV